MPSLNFVIGWLIGRFFCRSKKRGNFHALIETISNGREVKFFAHFGEHVIAKDHPDLCRLS